MRNRPRFTVSDCTDPMALFMVLLGRPDSFESQLLQERLGLETMRELASYRSPHDCTPSMIERLVGGVNALVFDPEFFISRQDRLQLDERAPRSRERLAKLLSEGRLVQRNGRYALGDASGDEGRDALRWLHVTVLEELIYPSFLQKGGMTEFKDVTSECPVTTRLVKKVPGLRSVWFSCLAPGAHILAHTGSDTTMLRCHLGLIVPDGCVIAVGSQLVSPNDFRDIDTILPLVVPHNETLASRLLRSALPAPELEALRRFPSLERAEDQDAVWKSLLAVSDALNSMIQQPGFILAQGDRSSARRAPSPVFDETFARLRSAGLISEEGKPTAEALGTEKGREELEYLNTLFFIEALYPQFLAKDPRGAQGAQHLARGPLLRLRRHAVP